MGQADGPEVGERGGTRERGGEGGNDPTLRRRIALLYNHTQRVSMLRDRSGSMHNAAMSREKQLNVRLSDDEAARLGFLTEHFGINPAALFRMLLKKEERVVREELGMPAEAPKPAKGSAGKR